MGKLKATWMRIIHSDEPIEFVHPSIMLCGPTPRNPDISSWRPTAINILKDLGFSGTVLVPERKNWATKFEYNDQVEWEWEALENCSHIVFWVPRKLPEMPGFVTNIEFGGYVRSGRAYYGRPDNSEKKGYLDWLYTKVTNRQPFNNLTELLRHVTNLENK
jgi:hypothetical protein